MKSKPAEKQISRFYCEQLNNSIVEVIGEEATHAIKVMRLCVGNYVELTDGKGKLVKAKLLSCSQKQFTAEIIECDIYPHSENTVHIAIAPTKMMERFEWFVEKSTEIGVNIITPIFCNNSERTILKYERLLKIIQSAGKQSGRYHFPELRKPEKFENFVKTYLCNNKFIAHCRTETERHNLPFELAGENLILIGPEGDFTKEEITLAIENGYAPIGLGNTRLRTETAGIVASTFMTERIKSF